MTLNMSRMSHASKKEIIECSEHKCERSHEYASLANPIGSLYTKLCNRHSIPPDLNITRSLKERAFNMNVDTFDKRNLLSLNKVFKELACVDQLRLYSTVFENKSLNRTASRGKPASDSIISAEPKLLARVCVGVKHHLRLNSCLRELMLAELNLSPACWSVLAKGLEEAKNLKILRLNSCRVNAPTIEKLAPALSRMNSLNTLDLAGNQLSSPAGYWLGRIISAHNNYRDMEMWASNLRGAEEVVLTGLDEVVLADCHIGDKVWQEILVFLTNDSWLSCIDLRNSTFSKEVMRETVELLSSNHTLLVLDLRGMPHSDLREQIYESCARNISECLLEEKTDLWFDRIKEVLSDEPDSIFKSKFLFVSRDSRDSSLNRTSKSLNSSKAKSLDLSRSNISTKVTATPKTPQAPVRANHSIKRTKTLNSCTCCVSCTRNKADLMRQVNELMQENMLLKARL